MKIPDSLTPEAFSRFMGWPEPVEYRGDTRIGPDEERSVPWEYMTWHTEWLLGCIVSRIHEIGARICVYDNGVSLAADGIGYGHGYGEPLEAAWCAVVAAGLVPEVTP